MADFEIHIKTEAELNAAKAAKDAIKQVAGAGNEAAKRSSDLGKELRDLGNQVPGLENLSAIFQKFGSGPLATMALGVAGISAALSAVSKGVAEFAQAEVQATKLDAALAQAGLLTDDYRERLQALSSQFQETTGVADDKWLGVLARLTQFGADSSNIDQFAEAVKNLAGIVGDVDTAAIMMPRAMQGSFDLFSRYGIVLGEAGTQTEKLNRLMVELATRGGGQLEAHARTLTGQYGQLKNAISDFFESIGRGVSGTGELQKAISGVTAFFSAWAEILGGTIPKVDGLSNSVRRTVQTFDDAGESSKKFKDRLRDIATEAQNVQKGVSEAVSQIRHFQRLQNELQNKRKALAIAKIDEAEDRGALSPSKAIQARANVEEQFAREKVQSDKQANQEIINVQRKALADAEAKEKGLATKLAETDQQIDKAKPIAARKERLSMDESELEKAREDFLSKAEAVDKLESQPVTKFSKPGRDVDLEALKSEAQYAADEYKRRETLVRKQRENIGHQEKSLEQLQSTRQNLQKELEATVQAQKALKEEIQKQTEALKIENEFLDQGAALDSTTRGIQTGTKVREAERQSGQQAIQGVHGGAPVGPHSINVAGLDVVAQLQAENQSLKAMIEQFVQVVNSGIAGNTHVAAALQQLIARQQQLEQRVANLRTR